MLLLLFTAAGLPPPRAIVAGAGVGGLYTAARLARAGVDVTVVEQNDESCAGGRLASERITAANGRSYRFETGPSLFLLPTVYRDSLAALGLDPDEHLSLARCSPSYAVHFSDGGPSPLLIGGDAEAERGLARDMEAVEPGSYAAYADYLASARANLAAGLPIFIREQYGAEELGLLPSFLSAALLGGGAARGRPAPLRDWPLRGHAAQADATFAAERHRALATFQDLYIGLPPADAPAVFSLLQAIELAPTGDGQSESGVFYPRGGWGTYRDALLAACDAAGVKFRWRTRVVGVDFDGEVSGDGRVSGVRVAPAAARAEPAAWGPQGEPPGHAGGGTAADAGGAAEVLPAGLAVVNADLAAAEPELLPPSLRRSEYREVSEVEAARGAEGGTAAAAGGGGAAAAAGGDARGWPLSRPNGWRYSSSSVSFYWSLDSRYEQLRHHNVFLGPKGAWERLFDAAAYGEWRSELASGPCHFYVHAPSRTDPSAVELPTDDAVMVLVPVPPIDERLSAAEAEGATETLVKRARAAVLDSFGAAGMTGFADAIVDERVRTPLGWRAAYGLRRGAVFGLSHSLDQLSLLRPARAHPGARGLHWVGASTRPGNGVPLVLIGAEKVAERALAELGMDQ